jgi:hypothetical protein
MISQSRLLQQIQTIIKKENDQMELNRLKGVGKTKAFEATPVNLNPLKPLKDSKGRVIEAITKEKLERQLHKSLREIQAKTLQQTEFLNRSIVESRESLDQER